MDDRGFERLGAVAAASVGALSLLYAVAYLGVNELCAAGLAVLVVGAAIRAGEPRLGLLGTVLGVDMVVLFLATAVGIGPLILLTGGLASVVVGPVWWVSVPRRLWAPAQAVGA